MRSVCQSIVFVINSLTAGGAERALVDVLAYLEDRLRGYAVHLVLLDVEDELHAVPPWVQKHVLNANFSFLWSTISLTRLLRGLAPAVTVSFLNRSNCANVISSKILKYPCIVSERTYPTSRFGAGLSAVITKVIMRLTYPHADQVIAVSEGVRADLMANFGVDGAKIRVIYNPVDTDRICERALETPSTRPPEPYIVSLGRLVPSKNFRLLIESYRSSSINENLVILGEGEERQELERLVSRLGLEGRVILPGLGTVLTVIGVVLVAFPFINEFIQGPFWLLSKIFVFLFVYVWMRGTLPRFRYDQLMSFGWKLLLPVSLANVVITASMILLRSH